MADYGPRILVDGEFDVRLVDGMFEGHVHSGAAGWTFCYTPHQAMRVHRKLGNLLDEFMDGQRITWIR